MPLFINGQNLNKPYWGVPRVAFELIRALDTILEDPAKMKCFGNVILLGRSVKSPMSNLKAITYEHVPASNLYIWEQIALARRVGRDPLLGLQNRNPLFKKNCATMIHDVQPLKQASSYSLRQIIEGNILLPIMGARHKTIITVSAFSAGEIEALGICTKDRLRVVHNGIDHRERRSSGEDEIGKFCLIARRYVVAQSSTKSYKNIKLLFDVFSKKEMSSITLVLFGSAHLKDFLAMGYTVPKNVVFVGLIDDDSLSKLLKSALCLAFPSLTEGFGLPPLEAMSVGTPAVVSDRGAIPEVCGDAAIIVDALDVEKWVEAILALSQQRDLWKRYSERGTSRASQFTWSSAGEKLFEILAERHSIPKITAS